MLFIWTMHIGKRLVFILVKFWVSSKQSFLPRDASIKRGLCRQAVSVCPSQVALPF